MGVVHKLKPEVIKFILDSKQAHPNLSCRNLTALLLEKFQVKVSKSSINTLFKENNLSMPVGRRQKQKKKKFNLPALPVIEGAKAIMLMVKPEQPAQEQVANQSLPVPLKNVNSIKEAEEWAIKLQEEERVRVEEKLNLEKQKFEEEDKRIKAEETIRQAEQDRLAKEAQQLNKELELQKEVERKFNLEKQKFEEEDKRIKAEAEIRKAEQDRLAKEAQELDQQAKKEELELKKEPSLQKNESNLIDLLPPNRACSGAIFLKAIDHLIGGSKQINEIICQRMGRRPEDFLTLTQALIFRTLFAKDNFALLCSLIGQQIPQEKIDNYSLEVTQIKTIGVDIARIISEAFIDVRGVKLHFIDGSIVYLDSQLHTTWSTPYLSYDFASVAYDLKNNINKYFFASQPLVLLSAPGFDVPTKEFFNLLANISSPNKGLDNLILYGNELEEFENIPLKPKNNYSLVFGLWPWQFTTCRQIKKIGSFNSEHIEGRDEDLYLAPIEMDLAQPSTGQNISLKGCALKTDAQEKIRVVILSTDQGLLNLNKLAQIYLSRWPNLEEGFGDFNRKVEVFTYSGSTYNFFSTEKLGFSLTETNLELGETFSNYIKILDAYLRWHFLPAAYIEKDLSFTNECFYSLPVEFVTSQNKVSVKIQINPGQQSLKDLEYLMRRFNERQVSLDNGKIIYFENAFK